ncbi:MAG: tRNA adenosine deaminase-associated protein [Mycobacteriales bacterium]
MAAEDDEYVAGVVVFREEGSWEAALLPERLVFDLDELVAALRQQPGEGGSIGLVNVADEFFVALRVHPDAVSILVSDVTAAAAWDLAREVVNRLDIPIPDDDDMDDVLPGGDLSIFTDLGLEEMELGAILADTDSYADEMLLAIAGRLGFATAYERALEGAMR